MEKFNRAHRDQHNEDVDVPRENNCQKKVEKKKLYVKTMGIKTNAIIHQKSNTEITESHRKL